ncbi:serine hydrolase domain-containing protein [Geomobilimonas luticola]|uniref:serine hydrolase domain-containing protein n=1 Tax=Geomobilimonas luticola TaxID=1114878 RepID=UPI0031B887C1
MNSLKAILISLVVLATAVSGSAETQRHVTPHVEKVDQLLESAIARGLVTGGVVLVGNRQGVLFEKAYGRGLGGPDSPGLTVDSLFDIASLTKVVATTPAVLKLAEERKLSLVDPVVRWFPEFSGKGKDDLLVLNLLTHTSGLDDFSLSSVNPLQSAIEGAAHQRLKGEVGNRFRYADINFILLGELVRRASGVGLQEFVANRFYGPLAMRDTGFSPDPAKAFRCAATRGAENQLLQGQVQDYPARQLGGVAGHAGLFTTIHDLARFCRMILNEGELGDVRVLSERAVRQMTVPYFSRGGDVMRGLGWDIASPFSSPKGEGFSRYSFGHTGYSGSSIWIDPASDTFVVLLTSRVDYGRTKEFSRLRGDLSTLAASLFAATQKEFAGVVRDTDE